MKYTAAVITVSDKCSRGERVDTSGPMLCTLLAQNECEVVQRALVPDEKEQIQAAIRHAADELHVKLILTTGGTGFSPRDTTPEATLAVATRLAPGIAEAVRAASMQFTKHAMLSRAQSVIRGKTLIINLPGSPKACMESMDVFMDTIPHAMGLLRNEVQDCARK